MAVPRLIARRLAPALAIAIAGGALVAPVACARTAKSGTVSGTISGPLPKVGHGEASVRAYDVDTAELVAIDSASRRGHFSLRLPAGGYLLVASSVRDRAVLSERLVPVSLRAGQRRTGVRISTARVKARPAARIDPDTPGAALPAATAGTPITYAIDTLIGDSSTRATLGRGLPALIAGDVRGHESCRAVQVASAGALRTITSPARLRRSKYFASSTKIRPDLTAPRLVVQGEFTKGKDDAHSAFTIRVVEPATGYVVDTLSGGVRNRGKGLFTDERRIAAVLAERLCQRPRTYKVGLDLALRGEYAAYNSTSKLVSTTTARATSSAPYATWSGAEHFTFTDNVFRSRVTGCPATNIVPGQGSWGATVTVLDSDQAQVDLDLTTTEATAYSVGDFHCPNDLASLTRAPGPLLVGLKPRAFTFPLRGGTSPIDSAIRMPIPGFLHVGSITLTPVWSHTLPRG